MIALGGGLFHGFSTIPGTPLPPEVRANVDTRTNLRMIDLSCQFYRINMRILMVLDREVNQPHVLP